MIPTIAAMRALERLEQRAAQHKRIRPTDFVRYEISFDSSRPSGDEWSAEFLTGTTAEGWDNSSTGFGKDPIQAVEQCFDLDDVQRDLGSW